MPKRRSRADRLEFYRKKKGKEGKYFTYRENARYNRSYYLCLL